MASLFRSALGSAGRWLARLGDGAAGAAISSRHVLTLASCLQPYHLVINLYSRFPIQVADQLFQMQRVRSEVFHGKNALSIVQLKKDISTLPHGTSACAGPYHPDHAARAMTWAEADGVPQEHTVTVYPPKLCSVYDKDFREEMHLCGSPGPIMCGSPLVQVINGQWSVVGLGIGSSDEISTYVQVGQAMDWLLRQYYDYS